MNVTTTYLRTAENSVVPAVATHLNYLDGLRALAALYVLIHHAILQVNVAASESIVVKLIAFAFAHGRYAVDLFIVISGFCLMLPVVHNNGVLRNGAYSFLKRRAKRILPTYYFAMAFSLLLIFTIIGEKTGTNWDTSIPVNKWDIITHLLLIQDVFHSTLYKINHVFWSISVEFHIYFLFPLLVLSWRKLGAMLTVLLAVAISLVLWFVLARAGLNVYGMSPHYLALFVFGMLATQVSFSKVAIWEIGIIAAFVFLVMVVHPIIKYDLIVGVVGACLLIIAASGELIILRQFLSWRPLVFIGTFAYSIYLVHAPLLQILSQYVINPTGFSPLFAIVFFLLIGVPSILCCSYLFFLAVERPFIRR